MNFIEELKRRKVFRVAASYAVVAFVIMQLVEILFPMFNFPQWTQQFTVIIVLLGFPIAVILSWVFDKTPQGYIKTDASKAEDIGGMNVKVDNRPFYLQKRNLFLVLGVVAGILIGTYGGSTLTRSIADDKSVAVLPFDNLGNDQNDEIFSDGITEDIISQLSNIQDVRVIARTSVLQYKGTTKNIVEIAKELGVSTILEGSVRRIGDDVRIVSQLIDVQTDGHLWAGTYDRKMRNIFEVQTDVAKKIAYALKSKLSPEEEARIDQIPTQNLEAYTLYKQGKEKYYQYSRDGYKESVEYFKRALGVDPMYSLAYAGLGDSYGQLFRATFDTTYRDLAYSAVEKALKLDENLAEGYKALGLIYMYDNNPNESLRNNLKAIKLKPGMLDAIANVGLRYLGKGDLSESLEWLNKAIALDPYHRRIKWHVGRVHRFFGNIEESEQVFLDGIVKNNDSFGCHLGLVVLHQQNGNNNKAKYFLDELFRLRPTDNRIHRVASQYYFMNEDFQKTKEHILLLKEKNINDLIALAFTEKKLNNFKISEDYLNEAKKIAIELLNKNAKNPLPIRSLAFINIMNQKNDEAFQLLEKFCDNGGLDYKSLLSNPIISKIKNDKRFLPLIDRIMENIDREKIEAGLTS